MSDWDDFHRRWSRLKPPLRANEEVIAAIGQIVADKRHRALLLGVTPELAGIARTTLAVDKNQNMIARIWPGDTKTRKAVLGDWRHMPLQAREFTAVIGDGSLNAIAFEDYAVLFAQLERLLLPGARLAVRLYETPEPGETVADVRAQAFAGELAGFHAFKWRLAMAMVWQSRVTTLPVARIHEAFEKAFPDRAALSAATGWSVEEISEIDSYAGNPVAYSFPTQRDLLAALPRSFSNPRFLTSGTYELAERCPIFAADFAP